MRAVSPAWSSSASMVLSSGNSSTLVMFGLSPPPAGGREVLPAVQTAPVGWQIVIRPRAIRARPPRFSRAIFWEEAFDPRAPYNRGMGRKQSAEGDARATPVCRNRRARHEYDILDEIECGIVLVGSEVKSIRNGKISIEEAYARIYNGELWLVDCDISLYPQANVINHETKRTRKLLLRKRELQKVAQAAEQKGLTLVPLAVFFSRGFAKLTLAVARGRKLHDKRESPRQKQDNREMRNATLRRH